MAHTINIKNFIAGIEIKPDEYLLPLQEAIVNAIQSIEDLPDPMRGEISIKVIRGKQIAIDEADAPYHPITGFEVYDNGIGFIKERFVAFNNAFTDLNQGKGCKGVGRYTVLACFGSMQVDSTFIEDNTWKNRKFSFDAIKGVFPENDENLEDVATQKHKTIIRLINYKPEFQDYINKNRIDIEDIAKGIIDHCLLYFLEGAIPRIRIYNQGDTYNSILINDAFTEVIKFDRQSKDLIINSINTPFTLDYVRNYKNRTHALHLCANKREVGKKINIARYIPSFVNYLEDNAGNKYYLSVYVTGDFFDKNANNQRNKFAIPTKKEEKTAFDKISIEELLTDVSKSIRNQYDEHIGGAEEEKNNRIREYIMNPEKPRLTFRHLLEVEGIFDDIPANASDERLESELQKKVFKLEQKRDRAFKKVFSKKRYDNSKEFRQIVQDVLAEEAAYSANKLADLLMRRKSVIKLFQRYLEWRNDENYMLEEDLHNIIFTMGAESHQMPKDYHNLWLLDERLTFNAYINSDKKLRTNPHIHSESNKEPDLLIYDFPWAYSDNPNYVNSLVLFEFKRPGRDMNTSKDKKLDSQLEMYFQKLMQSTAKNHKGRYLKIEKHTPKFGYIICDLHPSLMAYNEDYNGFNPTPHGSWFKFNDKLNLYIEAMSYETMIEFAEKRHEAFFKALGIDNI